MQRRFQSGSVFKRGKRRKVWVGRWREPWKMADGSLGLVQRSEILGTVAELSKKEARNLLTQKLTPFKLRYAEALLHDDLQRLRF